RVELCVEHKRAATERRLGAKLFQHQLLHGVIENSVARADAGLTRASKQLAQEAVSGSWTPRDADSPRERFVVRVGKAIGNALVAGNNQTQRKYRLRRAAGIA